MTTTTKKVYRLEVSFRLGKKWKNSPVFEFKTKAEVEAFEKALDLVLSVGAVHDDLTGITTGVVRSLPGPAAAAKPACKRAPKGAK